MMMPHAFTAHPSRSPGRTLRARRLSGVLKILLLSTWLFHVGCADGAGSDAVPVQVAEAAPETVSSALEPSIDGAATGPGAVVGDASLFNESILNNKLAIERPGPLATECCTEPGQITECWLEDAEADGATCAVDTDCVSGICNTTFGVCTCDEDTDCGDGVCNVNLLCGPSYCNGYRRCSCFGGCEPDDPTRTPGAVCASNGLECCDGAYTIHPEIRGEEYGEIGFCSPNSDCIITTCDTDADCPDDGDPCTREGCDPVTGGCFSEIDDSDCEDFNSCTEDLCDPINGCTHTVIVGACDDGTACTVNDTCVGDVCVGDAVACDDGNVCTTDSCDDAVGCIYAANTNPCDDGLLCTQDDVCSGGVCAGGPRNCNDGNVCTADSCDPVLGCQYEIIEGICDDGNACTSFDTCEEGLCVGGFAPNCDDENICTDDSCDPDLGCQNVNNAAACDDGNACTGASGDVCADGVCEPGEPLDCDDGNQCTDDSCNPAIGCINTNRTGVCDDDTACTLFDECIDGACIGTPVDCDDGDVCTVDTCDPVLGCENTFDGTILCENENLCTRTDRCSNGKCAGVIIHWRFEEDEYDHSEGDVKDNAGLYSATSENDVTNVPVGKKGQAIRFGPGTGGNVGRASTGYNVHSNSATMSMWIKFDEVPASQSQTLGAFSGSGKRFYLGIDKNNFIYAGYGGSFIGASHAPYVPSTLVAGEWARMVMTYDGERAHVYVNNVHLVDFAATFHQGGQGPEFFLGSNQGNVEMDEVVVDERYWRPEDVAIDYDDGNGPNPLMYTLDCDDSNDCTDDVCRPAEGCVNMPIGGSCEDGNLCTENDICFAGACGTGDPRDCDDGNPCTTDSCDPLVGCEYTFNTDSCDDGDLCTENDVCSGGTCGGTARDCDDGNPCTTDSCVFGVGCQHTTVVGDCDDGNACTENDTCVGGFCEGDAITCNDGDPCTADGCDPATGCTQTPLDPCPVCTSHPECEDQIFCTPPPLGCSNARCISGACVCEPVTEGSTCTDYLVPDYPENSWEGLCDALGGCVTTLIQPADNNLCSDLFLAADTSVFDTTNIGYLGAIPTDGTTLTVTGSTSGTYNNYFAGGADCDEWVSGQPLGSTGADAVYAFQYTSNTTGEYQQYQYRIKVVSDFDAAVYVKSDVSTADDCPEGYAPGMDESGQTYLTVSSHRCEPPYPASPMPAMLAETCRDNGNALYGQSCCDPCIDGADCGFTWCKRGYNDNGIPCDICAAAGGPGYDYWTYTGTCGDIWTAPADPVGCDATVPGAPGYEDYNYVATTWVRSYGATDGSLKKVLVFVDGINGESGNYYLTVEKVAWSGNPLDRVNDATRPIDITHLAQGGETFLGTLEGAVNSHHDAEGTCGQYDCTGTFAGTTGCHDGSAATDIWPNQEYYQIHRAPGEGTGTYCVITDESVGDAADLTVAVRERVFDDSHPTVIDSSLSLLSCEHDNDDSNVKLQFDADEDKTYLVELSSYSEKYRPCSSLAGDSCRYKLIVTEAECPHPCVAVTSWYPPGVEGVYTIDGAGFSPGSTIVSTTDDDTNDFYPWSGWAGRDEMWQIDVTADATVEFSGCGGFAYDGRMALFDCTGQWVVEDDNGCGTDPVFTADLSVWAQPYYLLIDAFNNRKGDFTVTMSYQ